MTIFYAVLQAVLRAAMDFPSGMKMHKVEEDWNVVVHGSCALARYTRFFDMPGDLDLFLIPGKAVECADSKVPQALVYFENLVKHYAVESLRIPIVQDIKMITGKRYLLQVKCEGRKIADICMVPPGASAIQACTVAVDVTLPAFGMRKDLLVLTLQEMEDRMWATKTGVSHRLNDFMPVLDPTVNKAAVARALKRLALLCVLKKIKQVARAPVPWVVCEDEDLSSAWDAWKDVVEVDCRDHAAPVVSPLTTALETRAKVEAMFVQSIAALEDGMRDIHLRIDGGMKKLGTVEACVKTTAEALATAQRRQREELERAAKDKAALTEECRRKAAELERAAKDKVALEVKRGELESMFTEYVTALSDGMTGIHRRIDKKMEQLTKVQASVGAGGPLECAQQGRFKKQRKQHKEVLEGLHGKIAKLESSLRERSEECRRQAAAAKVNADTAAASRDREKALTTQVTACVALVKKNKELLAGLAKKVKDLGESLQRSFVEGVKSDEAVYLRSEGVLRELSAAFDVSAGTRYSSGALAGGGGGAFGALGAVLSGAGAGAVALPPAAPGTRVEDSSAVCYQMDSFVRQSIVDMVPLVSVLSDAGSPMHLVSAIGTSSEINFRSSRLRSMLSTAGVRGGIRWYHDEHVDVVIRAIVHEIQTVYSQVHEAKLDL